MTKNARETILATMLAAMAITPLAVAPVNAQQQAQAPRVYAQAELDQMLAPIALYPDALLSQVLMAATYPIEVVEAARWTRSNPGLQGDEAVRAVQNEDWDPSVKSLVAFPQVLQRMDEHLDWTRSLGDAFLAQEPQMMDGVQQLRRRAQAAGNLRSDEQIRVEQQGTTIIMRPASPQYVYVPYYDPLVVYGPWWWPSYQPVVWAPWPDYTRHHLHGSSFDFWWGRPVGLSLNFFFGDFDWHRRQVHVVHENNYYYRSPAFANRTTVSDRGRWQHDPDHRRGVDYRNAEVRQRFTGAQVERRGAQREERREERRSERQVAPAAAAVQSESRTATPQRTERREERREDRREERRTERQAAPAVAPAQAQPQPAAQQRSERREDRREERRTGRQAAPATAPAVAPVQARPQRAVQPGVEMREERREERRADRRAERQAVRAPVPPQVRQEQRAAMPAAQAPQTPRVERQDRREQREERRNERGQRG